MSFPGLLPYFVAEPPNDAYRPLVIDDHGAEGIIVACDGSDAGLVEDSVEAALQHTMKLYPPINLAGVLIRVMEN